MEDFFSKIDPECIEDNIFKLIGSDWMLVTAGSPDKFNMMTASWGCAGVLWKKKVAVIFVRPQRHTYAFLESQAFFSLSFFPEESRKLLNLLGTTSGRDIDKMSMEGVTPLPTPSGTVAFQEARLVLECRKIYFDDITPERFQVFDIEKVYPSRDYHRFYIGEIVQAWEKI